MDFYQTKMGKEFFEGRLPALIKELKALNRNLSKADYVQEICTTGALPRYLDEGARYVGYFIERGETFCIIERRREGASYE